MIVNLESNEDNRNGKTIEEKEGTRMVINRMAKALDLNQKI